MYRVTKKIYTKFQLTLYRIYQEVISHNSNLNRNDRYIHRYRVVLQYQVIELETVWINILWWSKNETISQFPLGKTYFFPKDVYNLPKYKSIPGVLKINTRVNLIFIKMIFPKKEMYIASNLIRKYTILESYPICFFLNWMINNNAYIASNLIRKYTIYSNHIRFGCCGKWSIFLLIGVALQWPSEILDRDW